MTSAKIMCGYCKCVNDVHLISRNVVFITENCINGTKQTLSCLAVCMQVVYYCSH